MSTIDFTPRSVELPGALVPLAERWLRALQLRGYAANTIAAYRRDVERFAGYMLARDIAYAQLVSAQHVEQFIDALLEGEQLSPRTAIRTVESVRGFYRWLQTQGVVTANNNPLEHRFAIRADHKRTIAPEIGQCLAMIDAIEDDGSATLNNALNVRDRAMLRLMIDGALRISAVADLDMYAADRQVKWCVQLNGVVLYHNKGGTDNTGETVIGDDTLAAVHRWMELRERLARPKSPAALFLSTQGKRIHRGSIHARIKHHSKAQGMDFLHAHLFRHARVSDALERGDLHTANYLAGHKNKNTTAEIYGDQPRARLRNRIRSQCDLREVAA